MSLFNLRPRYAAPSSWWEHVPTAHWLVATLQPHTVVELGTHYGVSFFSFCEAAELLSPQTFVYAVDTWQGDEHAGNYSDEVFKRVSSHQQIFHKRRSQLLRSTFDEAADHFSNTSIDLLHIDGLHTYQAVSHDLEKWLPKLKPDSTILFHDTNVREGDFGVWQLWEELQRRPDMQYLELRNGYGLGIVTLGSEAPTWHKDFINIAPELISRGTLLDEIAQLKAECAWGESDFRPYSIQLQEKKDLLNKVQSELSQAQSELSQAQSELSQAQSELSQALESVMKHEIQIKELRSSASWRLTSPLRRLKRLLSEQVNPIS
jgi:hypothetical protein